MTGRAAGYCAGYRVPGFMNPVPGGGMGMAWGRGGGFGRGLGLGFRGGRGPAGIPPMAPWGSYQAPMYPQPPTYPAVPPAAYGGAYAGGPSEEQEMEMLKGQAAYLEDTLEGIKNRIAELEGLEEKQGKQ